MHTMEATIWTEVLHNTLKQMVQHNLFIFFKQGQWFNIQEI